MTNTEERVRAAEVRLCEVWEPVTVFSILDGLYWVKLPINWTDKSCFPTQLEALSAALVFTEEQIEEARQLVECIELADRFTLSLSYPSDKRKMRTIKGLLTRELGRITLGMKPEAWK